MADRGVSEVVGFTMVFALVVSMVLLVTVSGLGTLRDARDVEEANNAVRAMEVLSDNVADIHQRGAPSRASEIDLEDAQLSVGTASSINVSGEDTDPASNPDFIVKRDTAPLVYDVDDDTDVVYEAGAIFRTEGDDSVLVQEPPLVLGTGRTGIQLLSFEGDTGRTIAGSTVLVRTTDEGSTLEVANTTGDWDVVRYNVTSPRYETWEEYLVEQPGVESCETIDADEKVHCHLEAPPDHIYVSTYDVGIELEE